MQILGSWFSNILLSFPFLNIDIGEHPRMGALDVCPFIPVQDVTVDECVEISKMFGARLAHFFHAPVLSG